MVWDRVARIALFITLVGCRQTVPTAVVRFESLLENTIEEALLGDRRLAAKHAKRAKGEWLELSRVLRSDGATSCEIAALEQRVHGVDDAADAPGPELARAANAASAELGDVLRRYRAFVPARLLELDVLGRELILDADASEWRAADAAFGELVRGWSRLRPCAEVADPAGASGIDACIAQLARPLEARNSSEVILAANGCLDQVKILKRVLAP